MTVRMPDDWDVSPGRSRIMASIKRRDTRPEIALRSALHGLGLRFRKDFRLDLGAVKPRPDVVFTRARVAVFVDGCFWHVCPEHSNAPRRNTDYWNPKLARNVERDQQQTAALRKAGWTVVRIWEHESLEAAVDAVLEAIDCTARPPQT
jgi:DNA mismatch endonuclease (patch repair protein)